MIAQLGNLRDGNYWGKQDVSYGSQDSVVQVYFQQIMFLIFTWCHLFTFLDHGIVLSFIKMVSSCYDDVASYYCLLVLYYNRKNCSLILGFNLYQ